MRRLSALPRPSGATVRLLALALAIALVAEVPYLIAHAQASRGWAFVGMIWSPYDYSVYSAAMREGAATSSWLIHNHMTSEAHPAILHYPLYVGIGKLSSLAGVSSDLAFRLATIVSRLFLVGSLWRLSRVALPPSTAVLGFVLATFSTGVGGLVDLGLLIGLFGSPGTPYFATYRMFTEFNTVLALFSTPHLLLGLGLALEVVRLYLRTWDRAGPPRWPDVLRAGSLGAALGVANPFGVPALLLPLAAHLCLAVLATHRVPRGPAAVAAISGLLGLPLPVYGLLVPVRQPIWFAALSGQNLLPSPDLVHLLEALGVLLGLAILGLPRYLRQPVPGSWVLPVWCLTCLALMYAPISFQRRFAFGLYPMLAMLAAVGLQPIMARVNVVHDVVSRLRRLGCRFLVVLVLFTSNVILLVTVCRASFVPANRPLYFQPTSVADATGWLAERVDDSDVLLAWRDTGNWFARYGRGRVYVGHHITTVDYETKLRQTVSFLAAEMPADERRQFVSSAGIDYVLVGPAELELGAGWTASAPYLQPIYEIEGVRIYRVTPQ